MRKTESPIAVRRIVSGGQTGVDRGALDAALQLKLPHGGWCPRGRLAEDGTIPKRYRLKETNSENYKIRTELNVVDSDGTLILYRTELTGGTELTYRFAIKHGKPFLLVDLDQNPDPHLVRKWIESGEIRVMNVAGPRESTSAGIARAACNFVLSVWGKGPCEEH